MVENYTDLYSLLIPFLKFIFKCNLINARCITQAVLMRFGR